MAMKIQGVIRSVGAGLGLTTLGVLVGCGRGTPTVVASTGDSSGDSGSTDSASSGASDLAEAVRTAVINKRAGGLGLISGRKAFQRPTSEGVELLQAIQDVYLDDAITIA